MVQGVRRRARAYALQVLYALDMSEYTDVDDAVDGYWRAFDLEVDADALAFAHRLASDTMAHRDELDEAIQRASRNWRLERMSRVDRNILRLATCELTFSSDVPVKVVINEAVELAKEYGAAESAAFVNGILDRIGHQVRGGKE